MLFLLKIPSLLLFNIDNYLETKLSVAGPNVQMGRGYTRDITSNMVYVYG